MVILESDMSLLCDLSVGTIEVSGASNIALNSSSVHVFTVTATVRLIVTIFSMLPIVITASVYTTTLVGISLDF